MPTPPKTFRQKAVKEIKTIAGVTLYFATWLGVLVLIKRLMLEDYNIEFRGISTAMIGALVMAKAVMLMEFINLGKWVKSHPSIVDIVLRTLLYTAGVLVVFLLEKAFEARHEDGGFGSALSHVFHNRDIYKVWVGTIVMGLSLFWFNVFTVLQLGFHKEELYTLFLKTSMGELEANHNKKD